MKRDSKLWHDLFVAVVGGTIATIVGGIILFRLTSPSPTDATPTRIAQTTPTLMPSTSLPTTATLTRTLIIASTPTVSSRLATPSPIFGIGSTKTSVDGTSMVFVPAGEFLMGSNDADPRMWSHEKPEHQVYLDEFWIDKFEVTNRQYKKCVEAEKCVVPRENRTFTRNSYYGNLQYDNYPVVYVSWNDAKAFCEWIGKRLPTEAEWEKAARGTDRRIYPWGNVFGGIEANSWESVPRSGDTTAVGAYPIGISFYGALDMAGNVWEWTNDWYDQNYYKIVPLQNPKGPSSGSERVLRGGSWNNAANHVRVAFRQPSTPNRPENNIGFRCAQ